MMTFKELLDRDGHLVYRTRGVSMEPMLTQDRDLVMISVPSSRLKKYDVALYKRGDSYVLHRVIGIKEDRYLIRGDNTYSIEEVPFEAVIGVLTGFQRKGREYTAKNDFYQFYAKFWNFIYPLRAGFIILKRVAVSTARKLGILPFLRMLFRPLRKWR